MEKSESSLYFDRLDISCLSSLGELRVMDTRQPKPMKTLDFLCTKFVQSARRARFSDRPDSIHKIIHKWSTNFGDRNRGVGLALTHRSLMGWGDSYSDRL